MRRLVLPALCAGALAAPIPVAIAQSGPDAAAALATKLARAQLQKLELRQEARAAKRAAERRAAAKRERRAVVSIPPHLAAIARCESGGNPRAVGGGGAYRGMFQFDYGTWRGVGGSGDPAAASVAEQVKRARILYARAGSSPWPSCG